MGQQVRFGLQGCRVPLSCGDSLKFLLNARVALHLSSVVLVKRMGNVLMMAGRHGYVWARDALEGGEAPPPPPHPRPGRPAYAQPLSP